MRLIKSSEGFFHVPQVPRVNFILQTEIEVIWKYKSLIKKVHFILLFPNFEILNECIYYLSKYGNLFKEGRAKIYTSAENLIFGLKSIDGNIEITNLNFLILDNFSEDNLRIKNQLSD